LTKVSKIFAHNENHESVGETFESPETNEARNAQYISNSYPTVRQ
jgi:hypothetical protein